ncbi:MAG: thiamine pyrophosphate-binding protein [Anaerolineaceae bacterium]|nr:thiamine pyrophosphate-binding protein [Anaerolineaceae bacterium]
MTNVANFIMNYLADWGIKHIFLLTGGGAMFLDDAIGREKRIEYICNHHEQACAIAAEGYSRIKEKLAVVCVTTGPGGTNTTTGVLGQWLDSIPVLYLSGQVRYDMTVGSTGLPLRQFGDQEADIISIVQSITKYSVMVTRPEEIRYHLEKALYLATSGRPGPVWLDIPLNVQSSEIDESNLVGFSPSTDLMHQPSSTSEDTLSAVISRIGQSERPVLLAGAGIRIAGATDDFYQLAEKLGIPVQVAWDAIDLFPTDHPLFVGRPSTLGQRAANFIFQNSDLLLSIGCRLNVRQIGYAFPSVARAAYKIVVDVDPVELKKPTMNIDLPIQADAKEFTRALLARLEISPAVSRIEWLDWARERKQRYPVLQPLDNQHRQRVNPYVFCEVLSEHLDDQDIIVSSNGASCVIPIQVLKIKRGQRHIVNSGCAAMGYGLPSAIGASFARKGHRVICLEGDGSIQLNIQELQTVVFHHLPLKIIIFNNGGYLSIRSTQNNFFGGHFVGESQNSGVGFPDFVKLSLAYGIPAYRVSDPSELNELLKQALTSEGPCLVDVQMDPDQLFMPRIASKRLPDGRMVSSPLEDMYPFLNEEELLSNMIIPPWKPE